MASDRMLRGRLPWGFRRGRIFARSFVRSRLLVRRCEVVDAFCWGSGDAIECCASMLDRTGALIGEQCSNCYREGVLTMVVFEISPSYVKTFHHRPQRSQLPPRPTVVYEISVKIRQAEKFASHLTKILRRDYDFNFTTTIVVIMGRRLPDEVVYRIRLRVEANESVAAITEAVK